MQVRSESDDRDSVHAFARLRKTVVLGVCVVRLYVALAKLYAHFANGSERVDVAAQDCINPDCENSGRNELDGFCFTCTSTLAHEGRELERDLDHVLRLESEFIEWCEAHGQPHPHD